MNVSKRFLLFAVALVVCLVAAPITSVEAAGSTRLTGTLTIEFSAPGPNIVQAAGFPFTVVDQVKVAGITIPEAIRGGTFTTNAVMGACALDNHPGNALLRLKNATQGTVFKALVTSGAFFCLLLDGALRVAAPGDDPFKCSEDANPLANAIACSISQPDKVLNSAIAEGSVWFAQILQADPDNHTDTNLVEMNDFFDIPAARTEIRFRVTTIESSQDGSGNRGGSALGINSSAVDLLFKNP